MEAGAASLELASLLAEQEAQGAHHHVLTLRVDADADQTWAAEAVSWLAEHGRQPVLRARVTLQRGLIEAAARAGAVVEFELAHPRLELQRALLGNDAAATSTLLLQAQHLRALDVDVVARLGPLLPGIHEVGPHGRRGGFGSLLSHVRAADVHVVELALGDLNGSRLRVLSSLCEGAAVLELARSFGLTSGALLGLSSDEANAVPERLHGEPLRLDPHFGHVFRGQLRAEARRASLDIETTAEVARRAAKSRRRRYVGVVQGDLFFGT